MAKNVKKATIKLKDLNPPRKYNIWEYQPRNEFPEFYALLFNAFKVVDTAGNDIPYIVARRIKELTINNSVIGYDRGLDVWEPITPGATKNILDMPENGEFIFPNGKTLLRTLSYDPNPTGAYAIYTLPGGLVYADIIRQHTDLMYECDIAIAQNLRASKAPYFVICKDDNTRLSLEHSILQQQQGVPVIVVSNDIYDSFKGIPLDTPIIFDQIYEFRQKIRDNLLTKLSTLTSNKDKKERVQSAEVTAGVGECEDYIYALIDSFNQQAKSYGLDFRFEINSSLEELYTPNPQTEII